MAQEDHCVELLNRADKIDAKIDVHLDNAYKDLLELLQFDWEDCDEVVASVLELRAVIEGKYGNQEKSQFFYHRLLDHVRKHSSDSLTPIYINRVGIYYEHQEWYDSALFLYNEAHDLFVLQNNYKGLADVNNNKGNLYSYIGFQDSSFNYYSKALNQYKGLKDHDGIARVYNNIASHFYDLKDYNKALRYQDSALFHFEKIQHRKGIFLVLSNYAQLLDQVKGCGGGEPYFLRAIAITEEMADSYDKGIALIQYVESLICSGNLPKAIVRLKEAEVLADNLNSSKLKLRVLKAKESYYEKSNKPEEAYKYLKEYNLLKDSINKNNANSVIVQWKTKTNLDEKLRENEKLKNEIDQQEEINLFYNVALVFFAIIVVLLIFSVYQNKKLALKKKLIFEQNNLISEQEKNKLKEDLEIKNQLNKLLEEKYQKDIEYANKELYTNTLHILSKNELLKKLEKSINDILTNYAKELDSKANLLKSVKGLKTAVKASLNSEGDWEEFKLRFNEVNKDFFNKIEDLHPELTKNDLRMCAYLLMGFTSKDLERILNISADGIKKQRSRLRKRLNLDADMDLLTYLKTL